MRHDLSIARCLVLAGRPVRSEGRPATGGDGQRLRKGDRRVDGSNLLQSGEHGQARNPTSREEAGWSAPTDRYPSHFRLGAVIQG